MKTLIIYDNTGYIIIQQIGSYIVPQGGIQFLEVETEVYKNKIIKSVNVETKELVLEDIPKTDLEQLKEQVASLEKANAELTTLVSMQGQNA